MSDSHRLLTIFRYRSLRCAIDEDETLLRDGDQDVWSQVDAVTPRFLVPRFLIVQDSNAVAVAELEERILVPIEIGR